MKANRAGICHKAVPSKIVLELYFYSGCLQGCFSAIKKVDTDKKLVLVVDDTRFVIDKNLFASKPDTMLAKYVLLITWKFRCNRHLCVVYKAV